MFNCTNLTVRQVFNVLESLVIIHSSTFDHLFDFVSVSVAESLMQPVDLLFVERFSLFSCFDLLRIC